MLAIYGAADVEFGETGGEEAAAKLFECGDPACKEMGAALSAYIQANIAKGKRNLEKMTTLESNLNAVHKNLEKCLNDTDQCEEVPLFDIPVLEERVDSPPPINLP